MDSKKVILKSLEEITLLYKSAQLVSKTLGMLAKEIKPGVNTLFLDKIAEEFIRDHNGIPGFLGMYDFPNTLCVSTNHEVVHGIPNNKSLKDGDIVSIDCGVLMNNFYGDHAYTFEVGEVSDDIKRLLKIAKESLYIGIDNFRIGNRVGDISYSVQKHNESQGYGVVKELVGHGLGKNLHEKPEVPNFGKRGSGKKFMNGMVLAIEPMINMGTDQVIQSPDGWTIETKDGMPSAHYEHNVALVDGKPILLSTFDFIYETLGIKSDEEKKFKWNAEDN
ncbi:MAG: type I methionyl aminopeptidase [Flavobacteriaceae bacterium]|nr:type I methionyl aminopeptidase [Flavobacteriaceae bacterium]